MPIKHHSDFESFCKDSENPYEFGKALIGIMDEQTQERYDYNKISESMFQALNYKINQWRPLVNYNYTGAYLNDESRQIAWLKSRQIGISYGSMIKSLCKGSSRQKYEHSYVSVSEKLAAKLLQKGLDLIDHLQEPFNIELSRRQTYFFEIKHTGAKIETIPASSATRGFNSDVTLDELAFMPNADQVMAAVLQGTVRSDLGWNVEFISTPFGQSGAYYDIWESIGWDTDKIYSEETQREELYQYLYKVRKNNPTNIMPYAVPYFECPDIDKTYARSLCKTEAIWYQEYCLGFIDEQTAMLPYSVIRKNVDNSLFNYSFSADNYTRNTRILGVDFADGGNETSISLSESLGGVWKNIYNWHEKADEDSYMPVIKKIYYNLRPNRLYTDSTGLGIPVTKRLQKIFGANRVIGIPLTNKSKTELVYNMVDLFETGRIIIPNDVTLIKQLHSLKKTKTASGMAHFSGKGKNQDDDLVWSLALSLYEAIDEGAYEPVQIAEFDLNHIFNEKNLYFNGDDDNEFFEKSY